MKTDTKGSCLWWNKVRSLIDKNRHNGSAANAAMFMKVLSRRKYVRPANTRKNFMNRPACVLKKVVKPVLAK